MGIGSTGDAALHTLLPTPYGAGLQELLDSGHDLLHEFLNPFGFMSRAPLRYFARAESAPLGVLLITSEG
jgi:hypothetical protein